MSGWGAILFAALAALSAVIGYRIGRRGGGKR